MSDCSDTGRGLMLPREYPVGALALLEVQKKGLAFLIYPLGRRVPGGWSGDGEFLADEVVLNVLLEYRPVRPSREHTAAVK